MQTKADVEGAFDNDSKRLVFSNEDSVIHSTWRRLINNSNNSSNNNK